MTVAPPPNTEQVKAEPGWRRALRPLLSIPTPVLFVVAALMATYALWRQGSLEAVASSLREADPRRMAAILVVYAGSILILGLRWDVLVRLVGGKPHWMSSAEVFLTSVIVNYAAPIGLAVPTRAALTVRDLGLTPMQSSVVVGWELLLDAGALALIGLAWILSGGGPLLASILPGTGALAALVAIGVAAGVCVALLGWKTAFGQRIVARLRPLLLAPGQRPGFAALAVGLTIVFWGAQSAVMAALVALFGVTPTPSLMLGLMGLPMLVGMLSPVPGGAGVREALMTAMAGVEGQPGAPVLLAAVAYRLALFIVTPLVWGGLRLVRATTSRSR
ncbi:MAG: flippase-like domain-containing protein [Thermomicrobiales bacterium]|nr:flippase-like domain-containing protein [Thermomicrobiales bacterium]MCA9878951.1 flippase-like domain-containing protein [Thermomicrobiales bacterium]